MQEWKKNSRMWKRNVSTSPTDRKRYTHTHTHTHTHTSFPGGSDGKESACNVGDLSSMPVLGRSPGEGQGYPSSIVAWRIPWTEEPSGLWSIGLQELDTSEWLTFHLSYIYIKVKQIHQKKKKNKHSHVGINQQGFPICDDEAVKPHHLVIFITGPCGFDPLFTVGSW